MATRTARLADGIRRVAFQRSLARRSCGHVDQLPDESAPASRVCAACRDEGTKTVHLRMCLTCGNVACCDSSRPKHARRHHLETGHPMIRSIEPGESWSWCYVDRAYLAGDRD